MCQIVKLVTDEPRFNDSPNRCFKLPFVATEALCIDNEHNSELMFGDPDDAILNELMKFVNVSEEI